MAIKINAYFENELELSIHILIFIHLIHLGPPQVKCRLFISSIFDAMNFRLFFGNAGI